MRKYRLRACIFLIMIIFMPFYAVAEPLNDAIIAIVNTEVVTLKDLKDYLSGIYRQLKVEHKTPQEIQEIMATYEDKGVNQLIEDKLILAAAKEKGLEVRNEIVDKRLKEIKDRYPSEDQFLQEILAQGLTVTDIKNKILNQLKAKFMVDMEVRDKVFVNPENVTRYYNEHASDFRSKTRYSLDSIYVPFGEDKNEALSKIKEARDKIASGQPFDAVRQEYSKTPSVGTLEEGQMIPAVEKEVFTLKEGDLSSLVEVEGGVYLFKLNGLVLGKQQSLQEVQGEIYNLLFQKQFQEKFKSWMDKLRKKTYVEIRE